MDELVVIELFGEIYRFKPGSQVENPEQVVRYFQKYVEEAEASYANKNSEKSKVVILMLAAMNLAKDFHKLEKKYAELEIKTERKISSMLEKINISIEQYSNKK